MRKIISLILIGLFLINVSCEKDKNKEEDDQIIVNNSANNNSAILIGDTIGDDSAPLDSLRKIGKVLIEFASNDYYVDTVYFTRPNISKSGYTYWIMPIKNISENAHAFIQATDIIFLDKDNNIILQQADNCAFAKGSCGTGINSNIITNTFLRPNELGYFLGIENMNFDNVAKIKIKSITHLNSGFYYSNINVIPTSYNAPDHMYHHKINLSIKNKSNQSVYVNSSFYLLLDQSNRPLQWSFFSFDLSSEQLVSANSSASMVDKYSFYNGICNKIQPFLNLSLSSNSKSATSKKSSIKNNDEQNRDFILQRNNKIKQELQNSSNDNI